MERKVFKSAGFRPSKPRVRIGIGWWSILPNLELRLSRLSLETAKSRYQKRLE
jgi:hypothetical protein